MKKNELPLLEIAGAMVLILLLILAFVFGFDYWLNVADRVVYYLICAFLIIQIGKHIYNEIAYRNVTVEDITHIKLSEISILITKKRTKALYITYEDTSGKWETVNYGDVEKGVNLVALREKNIVGVTGRIKKKS